MATSPLGVEVGSHASLTRTVSEEDVVAFSRISGDTNPAHIDADYASKTRFKQRLAHGILSAAFISGALAQLTGPAVTVIYLSQSLRFRRPVFFGNTVTATVEVTAVDPERRRATLSTTCTNQQGEQIVTGEAEIMLDPHPFEG